MSSAPTLSPAIDAALLRYAEAVWHHKTADMRERYVELVAAIAAQGSNSGAPAPP